MQFCKVLSCNNQVFGGGYCKNHQYLREKSDEQKTYRREAKIFMEQGKGCEIKSPVCIGKIQGVQHKRGRIGKNLNDKTTWLRSCNPCNSYCESHPVWAKENGFAQSRLSSGEARSKKNMETK